VAVIVLFGTLIACMFSGVIAARPLAAADPAPPGDARKHKVT